MNDCRNQFIDFIRGGVIILMLWGHCIQYCTPSGMDFFENPVFKFIYSFHMPLFMLISGYLFGNSIKSKEYHLAEYGGKRIIKLLQPAVFGGILNYILVLVGQIIKNRNISASAVFELLGSANSLWFIWSVIAATAAVAIAFIMTRNIAGRCVILVCMLPLAYVLPNGTNNIYMFPYFVLSVLFALYKDKIYAKLLCVKYFCIPAFAVMYFFFQKRHYIYTTGLYSAKYSIAKNVLIHLFRWGIGLVGSIAVIVITKWIFELIHRKYKNKSIISVLGIKSLQIYIISCPLLSIYLPVAIKMVYSAVPGLESLINQIPILYNFVFTLIIAIAYAIILYWIVRLMEKAKISKVVFGR